VSEPAERPTEVVPAADAHAGPELDPEVAPEPPTGPPPPADADLGSASVPAGDPGASAVAPPPATRKRSKIIGIVIGAVVILLAICGVGAALLLRSANHTTNAKVGTCLTGDSINQKGDKSQQVNLKDVSCSNKDAKYKVVGRVEKKKETEATDEVCNPYPDADFIYWEGPKGKTGVVLCLATNG
jgi:hypothetical protein